MLFRQRSAMMRVLSGQRVSRLSRSSGRGEGRGFGDIVPAFHASEQILGYHASLLSGAEDFRLLNDDVGILGKTVAMATRACCDSFGYNGVTSLANLVKLRFRGYFCRFRCSFAERHVLFSSELAELHSDFWTVCKNSGRLLITVSRRAAMIQTSTPGADEGRDNSAHSRLPLARE